uniref:Serine protease n=1 Tax=Bosea sp. NBC_00436 TaxID=2969620 RepID=A0A9E8CS84_9HYPH
MEILKLFFGVREGRYAIQSMAPMKLEPADGHSHPFYKLKDGLFHAQGIINGLPNVGLFTEVLGQSIVPIVAQVPGEACLRCLGTGFFISCTGLLVTAAHVVADPIEREYGQAERLIGNKYVMRDIKIGIMIPVNSLFFQTKGFLFRAIDWSVIIAEDRQSILGPRKIDLRLTADVAVCQVEQLGPDRHYQPLSLVQKGMKGVGLGIGKTALAIGYGDMRDVDLSPAAPNVLTGDFGFDLYASHGPILERYPDNITIRQASAPGPCFTASLKLPGGMSGSPIFDHEGLYVHGVVSRSLQLDDGLAAHGYGCMLAPLLGLPLEAFEQKSVFDLLETAEHGMPKISAPDI